MPDHNAVKIPQQLKALLDNKVNDLPLYIAIDGHSGSGKSTIAQAVKSHYGEAKVTIIEGDDFYTGGSATDWDNRTAPQNAKATINRHQLYGVLNTFKTTGKASWYAFDWHSDHWDATVAPKESQPKQAAVKNINIIEGVYTAAPELWPLYDLHILVTAPHAIRLQRITAREHHCQSWSNRWLEAENIYFSQRARAEFDLVLNQTSRCPLANRAETADK